MQTKKKENSLLAKWRRKSGAVAKLPKLGKAPARKFQPLSYGQRRIWILQQLNPDNPFYNYTETFELKGALQIDLLKMSLESLVLAHGILRTSVHVVDGMVCQQVHNKIPFTLEICDLSHLDHPSVQRDKQRVIDQSAHTIFNLKSPPLARYTLLKLARTDHILVVTMHHLIMDAWSMDIFKRQLCKNYQNLLLDNDLDRHDSDLDYSDFAYWEQNLPINEAKLSYWRNQLSGDIPRLELPGDYQPMARQTYKGAQDRQLIPKELSMKIMSFCRNKNITPYTFYLSLFYLLLYKYSGQKDLILGSPVSNRNSVQLEGMMGFFSETMALRTKINPSKSFLALLDQVKETTLEAFSYREVPFDAIVRVLQLKRSSDLNPLFRVMFLYHAYLKKTELAQGLTMICDYPDTGVSKFDLTLFIFEVDGGLTSMFEYSTDLFHESTIRRMQQHLHLLAATILREPSRKIARVSMVTCREADFYARNAKAEIPSFAGYPTIDKVIDSISIKYSEKVAVAAPNKNLNYGDLLAQSKLVAKFLCRRTEGRNVVVGLCFKPSAELFIGLLGILKAGCAYLPLDPDAPVNRREYMLEDAGAFLVLTSDELARVKWYKPREVIFLEDILDQKEDGRLQLPEVYGRNLAYIIYTSGSTGKPKGVPVTHANIIASTAGRLDFYPENPVNFLLMSSPTFDSSKAGIFWTLCTGGTLSVLEKHSEQDIPLIESVIRDHAVTHTLMLPSLYQAILSVARADFLKCLRTVIVAGEACLPSLVRQHFEKLPEVALYNEYGPTEATVWCIAHRVSEKDFQGPVPIGKPVAGATIFLLNDALEFAAYGAPAHLYIGGPGLSPGYLNSPELNSKAFIDDPFEIKGDQKIYRTGDLARYNRDGNIEFLGRADQQVKIRGYRIELQEIENTIKSLKDVDTAVVLAQEYPAPLQESQTGNNTADLLEAIRGINMPEPEIEALLDSIETLAEEEQNAMLQELDGTAPTDPTL